jgi:tetratricopeptide (TPR) repeat protein
MSNVRAKVTAATRGFDAVCLLTVAFAAAPVVAFGNQESAALRARAFKHAYSLDYDLATRDMEAAVRADPKDVAARRGLAMIPWLQISFRRGAVTVDDYLGSISKQNVAMREPPADLAARFHEHAAKALTLAEQAVAARPNDAHAQYELGAVVGLQASYIATVEGRILAGFRAARRAYDTHESVLEMQPARKDAGLIVGMYRYVISQLSLPIRMMAYVAGFGGDKDRGIRMVEEAAAQGGDAVDDARFALVLLYNREGRYDEALRVLGQLQRTFPRNRILWLEAGATALRAGRPADAERVLNEGFAKLQGDSRPRMFGEDALWHLKRGTARLALDRRHEAEADLRRSLQLQSRKWVAGRAHAELGKIADLRGHRSAARAAFTQAVALAQQDNDALGEAAAERWVDQAYRRGQ